MPETLNGKSKADRETLRLTIEEAYPEELREASYEAFEGKLSDRELNEKVNSQQIKNQGKRI